MAIRVFYKPAGTNPEVEGPYYELSSHARIVGHFNFQSLTLGFEKDVGISKMTFRPIDPTRPIVLAVDDHSDDIGFILIDRHLDKGIEGASSGMKDYSYHKTNEFLIDCKPLGALCRSQVNDYWSVTAGGLTFVYGDVHFPNTWHLNDANWLCAFVAGELTVNQLHKQAYIMKREAVKEEKRQEHIERLTSRLRVVTADSISAHLDLCHANKRYKSLVIDLHVATLGTFPWIGRASVLQIIENNNSL